MISKFETLPHEDKSRSYNELNTYIMANGIKREDILKVEEEISFDHEDNVCTIIKLIYWGGNGDVTYGFD